MKRLSVILSVLTLLISGLCEATTPDSLAVMKVNLYSTVYKEMHQLVEDDWGLKSVENPRVKLVSGAYVSEFGEENTYLGSYSAQGYSDPYESCLYMPECTFTVKVTKHSIALTIKEQIQVDCGFGSNGSPIRPADESECDHKSSSSNNCYLRLQDGRTYYSKVTESCSGIRCYQTPRIAGAGSAELGNLVTGDPFAPWRVQHTKNISISLDQMAANAGISIDQLIFNILFNGIDCIYEERQIKDSRLSSTIPFVHNNETMVSCIMTSLWLASGHTREEIISAYQKAMSSLSDIKDMIDEANNEYEKAEALFLEKKPDAFNSYFRAIAGYAEVWDMALENDVMTDEIEQLIPSRTRDSYEKAFSAVIKYSTYTKTLDLLSQMTLNGTAYNRLFDYAFRGAILNCNDFEQVNEMYSLMKKAESAEMRELGMDISDHPKYDLFMYDHCRYLLQQQQSGILPINGSNLSLKCFTYYQRAKYCLDIIENFSLGENLKKEVLKYAAENLEKASSFSPDEVAMKVTDPNVVRVIDKYYSELFRKLNIDYKITWTNI